MKAALTAEQTMLRDLADSIGQRFGLQTPSELLRPSAADPAWSALEQAGLTDLVGPTGDSDGRCIEAAVVIQALARRLCPAPYLGQAVLAPALLRAAEIPGSTTDPGARRRTVGLDANLMFLHSDTGIAFDSADAELAVVVSSDGEISVHTFGEPLPCADLTRSLHEVGDRSGATLGTLSSDARLRWVALALTAVSADLLGVAEAALAAAVDYAQQREQYGRPIGANQAIQHLLAEQAVSIEGATAAVFHAAWAVDCAPTAEAVSLARVAKAYLSRVAQQVAETTIQVFGGLGMTWEAMPHVFLRRALLDGVLLGDERCQLRDIAESRLRREEDGFR